MARKLAFYKTTAIYVCVCLTVIVLLLLDEAGYL